MSKRFVIWAAVSSLPQVEKVSLQNQVDLGRAAATKHGGEVVAELIVPGESRDITLFQDACRDIEAYARLHDMIQARAFDVFVYLNHSRLGRDAALSMTVLSLCRRAGIILYDLEAPPPTLDKAARSHADLLISAIKSVGAEQEIIELTRRNTVGMVRRVERGDFPHAAPWGWLSRWEVGDGDRPRRIVEVDPQAAATLRLIVDEYLNRGAGMPAIVRKLNAGGYPPARSDRWHTNTVRMVIDRAWRYAGYNEINRRSQTGRPYIRAKSKWPAIISEDQAAALVAEQQRRWLARGSIGSPHRFSQVAWCAECNRRMIAGWKNSRVNGKLYRKEFYACRHKLNHTWEHCSARKVTAAVKFAIEYVQEPQNRRLVLSDAPVDTSHTETQIAECEERLVRIRANRNRADDAYTDGRMDEDGHKRQVDRLKAQTDAILIEMQQLQEQLIQEQRHEHRGDRLSELAEQGPAMLQEPDLPTAAAWFRSHIRIWISAGPQIEIEYI